MKTVLKISMLLNLGLVFALGWVVSGKRKPASDSAAAFTSLYGVGPLATDAAVSETASGQYADPPPFRWSQLESKDYTVYIKNLRAIGCPEQTIRDIITADVDSLYKARSRELQERLAALARGSLSKRLGAESELETELKKLPAEETAVIAGLLGNSLVSQGVAGKEPSVTGPPRHQAPVEKPPSMPVVLADVDLATLHLDDSQRQMISSLRQRFLENVGGPGQDPNDPAYLERWQKAQPASDEMLKGMIGINAFQQYDLAARANLHSGTAARQ